MIEVRVDDALTLPATALVRPADSLLGSLLPALTDSRRADQELFGEVNLREQLMVGSAVVTAAQDGANFEFLVHSVLCAPGGEVSLGALRRGLASTLHRIDAWELEAVTFPLWTNLPGGPAAEAVIAATVEAFIASKARFPSKFCIVVENSDHEMMLSTQLKDLVG